MDKKLVPFVGVGIVVALIIGSVLMNKPAKYDTVFPLPSTVQTFTKASEDAINFQTTLSVKDAESFYRTELSKIGLTERTINTAVTDTTFSMVFDGYKNGKAIVIQGVDLSGKTNINIRFEKI